MVLAMDILNETITTEQGDTMLKLTENGSVDIWNLDKASCFR